MFDESEISELLEDINVSSIKFSHERIGDKRKEKDRPIKVALQTQHDKDLIMKNLFKLKETIFNHLSITEDFTINERKKIKEMHERTKKLNEENDNNDFRWVIRGSPRTNLRIMKNFSKKPKNLSIVERNLP